MDIAAYLTRINYNKPVKPDTGTLRGLQIAHMLSVPFENLDISLGRKIDLSEPALWDKLVVRKRGGFCYELNGLFAWLLREIGFRVTYLNARVYNREGKRGIDFDHLTLLVEIPGQSTRWLADVGFGDSFLRPLRFKFDEEQADGPRAYRLGNVGDGIDMWQRNEEAIWERQYFFDLIPRAFSADYEAACIYHQTSPNSSFTQKRVISLATPSGRKTLSGLNYILTTNGKREERVVTEAEYPSLLKEHFRVALDTAD